MIKEEHISSLTTQILDRNTNSMEAHYYQEESRSISQYKPLKENSEKLGQ